MSRRAAAATLVLAAAAIVGALAAVLVIGSGEGGPAARVGQEPIAASASISPRVALFGDTVTARVDITVDNTELDPELLSVKGSFAPWTRVGEPTLVRQDTDSTSYLRTTFVLRCLSSLCVPTSGSTRFDFKPARARYEAPAGEGTELLVIDAQWPPLLVHSRLDGTSFSERDPLAAPWRADLVSLPAVTYHVRPRLLTGILLAGGVVLILVAGVLGYPALPRRREPAPEPAPAPAPEPALTPLEQALVLLETPAAADGVADRRRALELVADEFAGRGDRQLERTARALAWSEEPPATEATRALAASVRARAGEGLDGRA